LRAAPAWLLVLFWAGCLISAAVALLYAGILVAPDLPVSGGMDPHQLRLGAALLSLGATALFLLQVVASIGLTRRRPWARLPATAACLCWALTCIGIPLALAALTSLWRRADPAAVRQN